MGQLDYMFRNLSEIEDRPAAGEVERTHNRASGRLIILIDRENGGDWIDADDRWVTFCDEHATTCSHGTRALARSFMAAPDEWCEECGAELSGPDHKLGDAPEPSAEQQAEWDDDASNDARDGVAPDHD